MTNLAERLACLGRPRLLVVGDLMLDRYTWGDAERVSPEAPVLVLRADDQDVRPGGAASVAFLVKGLDADVEAVGLVGDDPDGRVLRHILREAGVDDTGVFTDGSRPTTSKDRFLGRTAGRQPHQILRVDRETRAPIDSELEHRLIQRITSRLGACDAVLISDYAKGLCTPPIISAAIDACRRAGRPVLIDPARIPDYERYRGATVLKPNRTELQMATQDCVASVQDAASAAERLCRRLDLGGVVATMDRDGMVLAQRHEPPQVVPTFPQEVCDVTGAGDMSLAMLGLCIAGGLTPLDAVRLANAAAAIEVQRVGVCPVGRREVAARLEGRRGSTASKRASLPELVLIADACRRQGKRIVFTNGCFDLLHVGHVVCLEEASAMGDVLIVAVNSDASVRRLKGATRPVIPEGDRATLLAALSCVDYVVVFDDDTPHALLEALRPDVLVKGGTTPAIVGAETVSFWGGHVYRTQSVPRIATTQIIRHISIAAAIE